MASTSAAAAAAAAAAAEQPRPVKHLIVDSSPLFTSPLSSFRQVAERFLVTPDVVAELRDRRGRQLLDEAKTQLPGFNGAEDGLSVRTPTADAISRITSFARQTGDIAVLSAADIRVLALCLTLELEENGDWRVRTRLGETLPRQPPPSQAENDDSHGDNKVFHEDESTSMGEQADTELAEEAHEKLDLGGESAPPTDDDAGNDEDTLGGPDGTSDEESADVQADSREEVAEEPADEASDAGSDSSGGGEWITPDNLQKRKARDMGLFSPLDSDVAQPARSQMKAAVITGDFAMQNVALQMGLNVFGNEGKRVRFVKSWVLRCHACYKICKEPEKRFCPSCGGPTLLRTSVTYVPASPEHPQGYILHLKKNFQYRNRGTRYSLPKPKVGSAGGAHSEPVLREDQKEWQRGVHSADISKRKEARALDRAAKEDQAREAQGLPARQGFFDPDWTPAMLLGEKGRRGGRGAHGRQSTVPVDKMGLPVIGSGRRNPNASRGKRK